MKMDTTKSVTIRYYKKGFKAKMVALYIGCACVAVTAVLYFATTRVIPFQMNDMMFLLLLAVALVGGSVLANLISVLFHLFQPKTIEICLGDVGMEIGGVTVPYQRIHKAELSLDTDLREGSGAGFIHIVADDEYFFESDYSALVWPRALKREDVLRMNSFNYELARQLLGHGFEAKEVFNTAVYQMPKR